MNLLDVFREIIAQRAPRWVHVANSCNIIAVSEIICTYDRVNSCRWMFGAGTYLRAVPRDCARLIFKSLRETRWGSRMLIREFLGRPPYIHTREGSGIPGRSADEYRLITHLDGHINIFYEGDMIFTGAQGRGAIQMLCGYYHGNGIVFSGTSAAIFDELLAGAVAIAGHVPTPHLIQLKGGTYILEYWCRGYLLANTNISRANIHTVSGGEVRAGVYDPGAQTTEFKRRLFEDPLP